MKKLFGTNKNLYQYKIDVEIPFDYNLQIAPPYKGTGHAADLFYLFDRPISHNFDRYFAYVPVSFDFIFNEPTYKGNRGLWNHTALLSGFKTL